MRFLRIKRREAQSVKRVAVRGRYVLVRVLTEVDGNPWASAAEIGVVGE